MPVRALSTTRSEYISHEKRLPEYYKGIFEELDDDAISQSGSVASGMRFGRRIEDDVDLPAPGLDALAPSVAQSLSNLDISLDDEIEDYEEEGRNREQLDALKVMSQAINVVKEQAAAQAAAGMDSSKASAGTSFPSIVKAKSSLPNDTLGAIKSIAHDHGGIQTKLPSYNK